MSRCNAYNIGDYHDPLVTQSWALGIESVYAVNGTLASEKLVIMQADSYGGR